MAKAEQETRAFNAGVDEKLKGDCLSKSMQASSDPVLAPKQAVVTKIKQKPSKKRTNIIKLTDSVAKLPKKKTKAKEEAKSEDSPVPTV
jgi:hypothetical protein